MSTEWCRCAALLPARWKAFRMMLKKERTGGMATRQAKWRAASDMMTTSVLLDEDDIRYIKKYIEEQKKGGWQADIAKAFTGTLPEFTGLVIQPRPPRAQKRGPWPRRDED